MLILPVLAVGAWVYKRPLDAVSSGNKLMVSVWGSESDEVESEEISSGFLTDEQRGGNGQGMVRAEISVKDDGERIERVIREAREATKKAGIAMLITKYRTKQIENLTKRSIIEKMETTAS